MSQISEEQILSTGTYDVPWPHKILTYRGVHPATKFQKLFKIAGIILIVSGVLSIVFSIATSTQFPKLSKDLLSRDDAKKFRLIYNGTGYWSGFASLAVGFVALMCGKYKIKQCTLLSAFVLCVFGVVSGAFVCYLNIHNAVIYISSTGEKHTVGMLEFVIGVLSLVQGCLALAIVITSGSTLCSCSNHVGYTVATEKEGLILEIK